MKHTTIVILLCLLLCSGVLRSPLGASGDIPDDHLSSAVLLTLSNNGKGSGFYFNFGKLSFLVTARHVLFDDTGNLRAGAVEALSYTADPKNPSQIILTFDLKALQSSGELKGHPSRDVAVIHFGTFTEAPGGKQFALLDGIGVKVAGPIGFRGYAGQSAKTLDAVSTGNQVYVFGYPVSLGLKNTKQFDFQRPLIRKGIVAGKDDHSRTLVLDCPMYPGNSGGPVMEVEHRGLDVLFNVIGVVTDFVPAVEIWQSIPHGYTNDVVANSGYSIAVPMDFVLELVKQY